jgi:trimeric autotransporter adhesin
MKGQLMKKQKNTFTPILMVLGCFAFLPQMQAVNPPPDGCYPNYTTAEGCSALNFLTTGAGNTGLGWYALYVNTTGSFNTGVGGGALALNNGDSNTATGAAALLLNTSGGANTAVGTDAMVFNDTGGNNTGVGAFALFNNIDGFENCAVGASALYNHQTGSFNNAVGGVALNNDESGAFNNAFGDGALENNVSGSSNTAVGDLALSNSTGDYNTALGASAGTDPGIGSNNIYIGDSGFPGDTNVISIGGIPASGTAYENTYIGGIYDTVVTDRIVYVASDGHLGTLASSRRYKEEIKPMDNTSEALYGLKPVTFRYKQQIDPSHKLSFGLVAEEVAKVSSDLISRDKEGKPQTVRYEAVNAMLLNEFLKEHQKVQDLESRLAQQEKQIESLTAGLQKVSAQLETSRPAPQVAVREP